MFENGLSIVGVLLMLIVAAPFLFGTFSLGRDLAAETRSRFALPATSLTAGGTGDNAQITGATLDLASIGKAESVVLQVGARAVLAAAATLIVTAEVQTSVNGSDWTTLIPSATILTLTGGSGGTTELGCGCIGVNLSKAQRYIRIRATPDLSAANTDTGSVFGIATFGGLQKF